MKNVRNDSEKADNSKDELDIQYRLVKDLIRALNGRMSDPMMLGMINSRGFLGYETNPDGSPKKDKDDKFTTKKISIRTFYRWKHDALSLESIQKDFTDFVKMDYAIQVAGIKAMLEVLVNVMIGSVMVETDSYKKANLAHKLFTDLPLLSQFLDIEKRAITHGKISLKDNRKNENSSLVASN